MTDPRAILEKYWGHKQFRPLQEDIVNSAISGQDLLALLPTGGGKSVCFQVPGLAKNGLTLVVSPLIALMKDQVEQLQKKGIEAKAIYSGMSAREIDIVLDACAYGKIKFLYLSPERLVTDLFKERLSKMKVSLLAVDEAHCISQWGYDFRPEYLRIAELRSLLKGVNVIALTASATEKVVKDIQEKLLFKEADVFRKSFARSNLSYAVLNVENKNGRILELCKRLKGTGAIYVRNRRNTVEISRLLNQAGISADYYHAGLSPQDRAKRQDNWINNKTRIMVCTNAFGMGIDKADVRFVLHYEIPESPEAYYQEAGRAGRDEQHSWCILLFNNADKLESENRIIQNFPPEKEIKRVYEALANYYGLATGAGKGEMLDFDLSDFCSRFELKPLLVMGALKILAQSELLEIADALFEGSRVRFLVDQFTLYQFQVSNSAYDPFVKLLLRSYGGGFDQYVKIDEKELSKRFESTESEVKKWLLNLKNLQIIDYVPARSKPTVSFIAGRIPKDSFKLKSELLKQRKDTYIQKLNGILGYAENLTKCRSRVLLEYFDEAPEEDCGTCDVCREKKRSLNENETKKIIQKIEEAIRLNPYPIQDIVKSLPEYPEKNIMQAVQWLLDQDLIKYNDKQQLTWKK